MIDENNIPSIQPDFERIKKQDNKGLEYWTSRELCTALGYGTYQKFNRTLNKAIAIANKKGCNTTEHFNATFEMVKLNSGSFRKVENIHLSRIACLMIAENADSKKPQVQIAFSRCEGTVAVGSFAAGPVAGGFVCPLRPIPSIPSRPRCPVPFHPVRVVPFRSVSLRPAASVSTPSLFPSGSGPAVFCPVPFHPVPFCRVPSFPFASVPTGLGPVRGSGAAGRCKTAPGRHV